jgi:hypothetical protein
MGKQATPAPDSPVEEKRPYVPIRVETELERDRPPAPRRTETKPRPVDLAVAAANWTSAVASSQFPKGVLWEIERVNAWRWFVHKFRGYVQSESVMSVIDITSDELMLLIYDLDHYEDWCIRWLGDIRNGAGVLPQKPPPLPNYLRPGREHWGTLGQLPEGTDPADLDDEYVPDLPARGWVFGGERGSEYGRPDPEVIRFLQTPPDKKGHRK